MPLHYDCSAILSEVDEMSAGNAEPPADKATEILQSQLINAFEVAIYQGMQPMDALAVILSWMSSEVMRIQSDQAKRASW